MTSTIPLAASGRLPEHGPNCPAWCDNNEHCDGRDCGEGCTYVSGANGTIGFARRLEHGAPGVAVNIFGVHTMYVQDRPVPGNARGEVEMFLTMDQFEQLFADLGEILHSLRKTGDAR